MNIKNYIPLILVILYSILLALSHHNSTLFMTYFMGYFFIFLSLFKLFDIKGFISGFQTYDLVAKKYPIYAYAYPFLEFLLGFSYINMFLLNITLYITCIIMFMGGVSILKSIIKKEKIQCACLGTILKVPLTTVSLTENLSMGFMALYMILRN